MSGSENSDSVTQISAWSKIISEYKIIISTFIGVVIGVFSFGVAYKSFTSEINVYKEKVDKIEASMKNSNIDFINFIKNSLQVRTVNFIIDQNGVSGDKTAWLRFDPRDNISDPQAIAKKICGNMTYQLYPASENLPQRFWSVSCIGAKQ